MVAAAAAHVARGFGITAFYHRLFSHHAFQTSRPVQFVGAVLASSAAQRGPLWWVAHHRRHHRISDKPGDLHSPLQRGLAMAHLGWQFESQASPTHLSEVPDLAPASRSCASSIGTTTSLPSAWPSPCAARDG